MSAAAALSSVDSIQYQFNTAGNVRAPISGESLTEIVLDQKLTEKTYATPDYLATLGGRVAQLRADGFTLSFQLAQSLGIEKLNEHNGQWTPVISSSMYAVVATLE